MNLEVRFWDGVEWPDRRVTIAGEDSLGNKGALFINARFVPVEDAKAKAEEIVRKCNSQGDLYEALTDALCALEVCGRDFDHVMGKARKALEKARGETV